MGGCRGSVLVFSLSCVHLALAKAKIEMDEFHKAGQNVQEAHATEQKDLPGIAA